MSHEQVKRVRIAGQEYDRWTVWEDHQHNQSGYRLPPKVVGDKFRTFRWRTVLSAVIISLMMCAYALMDV